MAEPKPEKEAAKVKETELAARHHAAAFKVSACYQRGSCQN
jgi:hypothetical protein